jgi:hypothetical protein
MNKRRNFLDIGLLPTKNLLNQGFLVVISKALRPQSWLGWLFGKVSVINDVRSNIRPWLIIGVVRRATPRVPHVEQELLTLLEHMGSFPVLSGVRVAQSIVFRVLFNHQPLFVLLFFFSDCIVCPSSTCCFWFPIRYLQTCRSYGNGKISVVICDKDML